MGKKRRQMSSKDCAEESANMEDWISNLARTTAESTVSKKERIERRQAKKRKRQEQQRHPTTDSATREHSASQNTVHRKEGQAKQDSFDRRPIKTSKKELKRLATVLRECVQEVRSNRRPYYISTSKKSAVVKHKKKRWDSDSIQPRHCDYGGIGLARPSLFLALDDPSFFARLEQEFKEHIPGFFGRTKAMKKNKQQSNSKMLWKQLQETKKSKLMGKKLSDMSPDERVEAMLQAGML